MLGKDTGASGKEFYVNYLPFDAVDKDHRSQSVYATIEDVRKEAKKAFGFRSRLLSICQQEFSNSVANVVLLCCVVR